MSKATSLIDPAVKCWGVIQKATGEWNATGRWSFERPDDIHVFRVSLRIDENRLDEYATMLGPSERERASRFRFPGDRARFIAAHGALREIVGAYTGVSPARVGFRCSRYGKPGLAETDPASRIEFNMSHSRDIAVIAISKGHANGVDVEFVPENTDGKELAEISLSPEEMALLEEIPHPGRIETLYRWWTRKEALAKAQGEGLNRSFPRCQVVPPFLAEADSDRGNAPPWGVWDISPSPGYVATLVADGPPHSVSLMMYVHDEDSRRGPFF